MRLENIWIRQFKNLRDFNIEFDQKSYTMVLVGRNGTGKSNLLEALTVIFRDLDLDEGPSFAYRMKYTCTGHTIEIDADPERPKERVKIKVDGKEASARKFAERYSRLFLSAFLFGYYSGPGDRMERHFDKHQERFYRDLVKGVDRPLRPLFYARLIHSQFVLLAFFLKQEKDDLEFLHRYLGIESLDSVLFVMREPSWKSRKGDERFWKAAGTVQRFLDLLYQHSLAPLRLKQRIDIGFRKTTTKEHLYLFLDNVKKLQALADQYGSQQELFKALESTYISELLSEVRIKVRIRNIDGVVTFRELSDGEQQLLMVLGLLKFTQEQESLFLLDEPDTHLNPAWSLQYIEFLKTFVKTQENSHMIMATHDPLVIAGLEKSQVRLMLRNEKTGKITAEEPERDPKGMGIAGLLRSELYGLRAALDMETVEKLDRRSVLYAKGDKRTRRETKEMILLSAELADLGFAREFRDPIYQQFVEAMARHRQFQKPVLSHEQLEKQEEIADKLLDEILSESKK